MSNKGERLIVSVIGKTNTGKSSFINALIGQNISIVSDKPGTTTDSVAKIYELIPVGPVTFYDTAGYDDKTELGQLRIKACQQTLWKSDIAIMLIDSIGFTDEDLDFINQLREKKVPFIVVYNKSDLSDASQSIKDQANALNLELIRVSSAQKNNLETVKNKLKDIAEKLNQNKTTITDGLIKAGDKVILVIPIDTSAPKNRIILPQVQILREILDLNAVGVCVQHTELDQALKMLNYEVDLVITDSQAINFVNKTVPEPIRVSTFSVLLANYKGELSVFAKGVEALDSLQDGDKVLVAEACSHHVQCDDIGQFKIPRWIKEYCGKEIQISQVNGYDFPEDLETYKLVIHCGGCMITATEIKRRIHECERRNVPITNYGMLISKTQGTYDRVVKIFKK
jgi:[FeFe] hydrogenase H-cluster maturation GTPase HydF